MKKPHILHATSPHGYGLRIECPGADVGGCRMFVEADECQCTNPQCPGCVMTDSGYDPDHELCDEFDDYSSSIGAPPCRQKQVDACGAVDWFGDVGMDMVSDADWPGDSPWKAEARWDSHGEYMELVPWKGEALTERAVVIPQAAIEWIGSGQTGLSSKTIWHHMAGGRRGDPFFDGRWPHPHDAADLARCVRLLEAVPEWADRIAEMATRSPQWAALVAQWDTLVTTLDEECPDWRASYPSRAHRCDALMQAFLQLVES